MQLFNFPLGSAVPGAVVSDAKFEWTTAAINVSGGDQQTILDYISGNITAADWCDGAALAALTVWGTIPSSGFQANSQTYQTSLNETARTAIQALLRSGSTIGFMVVAQAQIDGTAPAGNDRYDILSDDDPTAANRPGLIITYSTDLEISVALGSVPLTGLVPAVAVGAAALVPAGAAVLAAFAPLVSGSINLVVPIAGAGLAGLVLVLGVDAVIRAGPSLAAVAGWAPVAVIGTVVRAAMTPAVALSAHDPVRAGPLWRAINENQAVWEDRTPTVSTWTPVSAA